MRTHANKCERRGEGWHIRVLSIDSYQLTLIFSPTHHNPAKISIMMSNILSRTSRGAEVRVTLLWAASEAKSYSNMVKLTLTNKQINNHHVRNFHPSFVSNRHESKLR